MEDPFPTTLLALDTKDSSGPLLLPAHPVSMERVLGKTLYKLMVKTLNKNKLYRQTLTPWRSYLGLDQGSRPQCFFIYGFRYTRQHKQKSRLLNFVLGQAKMAVYVTRKRKVEENLHIPVCVNMIKTRILVNFGFYKAAVDLDSFNYLWCFQNMLCSVAAGQLVYADYLI